MMKLHEAIEKVLKDEKKPMTATEIAEKINQQGLYERGDKLPLPASQVSARVGNKTYVAMFEKKGGYIKLR
ncbi:MULTISPECIES: winged helix-turn-helix domain-containing protein [unclassified Butyricimonas]|uniref:winged helix-turn-helix domain-containing protein n=1 Tax=unclassified Butyricimonas TaxID=2637652 RepID=UPI000C0780F9|nr:MULTISPECIES: winged helix-turn-helix domain-containing protein [unclassified Butyricimonas]